ncbi:MAG: PP2C family protein-serine/threonine phosphatase [Acidimicrobiales bacterium]
MFVGPRLLAMAGGMFSRPWLLALAIGCAVAAVLWGRSARRLERAAIRIEAQSAASAGGRDAVELARSAWQKDLHATVLYGVIAIGLFFASLSNAAWVTLPLLAVAVPVVASVRFAPKFLTEARLAEERAQLERRAAEVLAQEELAPRRWAARLAPADLPQVEGFELGRVYEPGTGAMAGDFYDVYVNSPDRVACVIGDVAGHGIEPSITAFQVKYLLRNFLRQYRDPAQAMEELNVVLSATGRPEDLVSCCAVVFDTAVGTVRYASAGHPAVWLWHDGELRALRATGPLLTLDPAGTFHSREMPLDAGDLLLMYTDGLSEARAGGQLFGEERIANIVRRDPGQDATTLCKVLLEAARDFASEPLSDDVAILAVRRT